METVNALKVRNHLGEVLDKLEETGEPILVSKNRKVRAVLITPEDFERRFIDKQNKEKKQALLKRAEELRDASVPADKALKELRRLRGYSD